jgi:flagellar protein FlaF
MHPTPQARSGYAANPVRTARGAEYALFAQITARLKALDESDLTTFPVLASAVADNQHLWGTLAEDLMSDANRLPVPLRAQLISLAEFVRKHSLAVLGGRAKIGTLIDINTAIMKGLRGNLEAAA